MQGEWKGLCKHVQAFLGLPDVGCDRRFVAGGRIEQWVYELKGGSNGVTDTPFSHLFLKSLSLDST